MEDGKEADKGDLAGKAEANAARQPLAGEVQSPAPVVDPVQRVNER
jgi:hypothetical protein